MSTTTITVHTFKFGTDKEVALKPLEEAAEVYAAWQRAIQCDAFAAGCRECPVSLNGRCREVEDLASEIADVIQASCNLAARYGIDLQEVMDECYQRNCERGRVQ